MNTSKTDMPLKLCSSGQNHFSSPRRQGICFFFFRFLGFDECELCDSNLFSALWLSQKGHSSSCTSTCENREYARTHAHTHTDRHVGVEGGGVQRSSNITASESRCVSFPPVLVKSCRQSDVSESDVHILSALQLSRA